MARERRLEEKKNVMRVGKHLSGVCGEGGVRREAVSDVIHHSIKIVTDGKLCGNGCPWLPKKVGYLGYRYCKLFNQSVTNRKRCPYCVFAVRRLKRMKP